MRTNQRLCGCLFSGLALILLGVALLAPLSDPVVPVLLGLATGLTVAACTTVVTHVLNPCTPWRGKVVDLSILLVSFAAGALLLVVASTSGQITFSSPRVACGSGIDAVPIDGGKELLLSWHDAGVNTYCRVDGPYPASGAERLVIRLSNVALREAHASFKVDAEGMHLKLTNPADANTNLVGAPWGHLRPGNIGFELPEQVVQDRYIADITLTFHGVRHGSLQVMALFEPSRLRHYLIGNWPILLVVALVAAGSLTAVAWAQKRYTRRSRSRVDRGKVAKLEQENKGV